MMPITIRPTPIAFLRNFFTSLIVDVQQAEVEPAFLAKQFAFKKHLAFGRHLTNASVSTSPFCLCHLGIFLDQAIPA